MAVVAKRSIGDDCLLSVLVLACDEQCMTNKITPAISMHSDLTLIELKYCSSQTDIIFEESFRTLLLEC